MEEKKVKIEISRLALVFIVLFGLSLLIWSFVIGVWVGTKIGAKPEKEVALEQPPVIQGPVTPPSSVSNETVPPSPVSNETIPPSSVKTAPSPSIVKKSVEKEKPVEKEKFLEKEKATEEKKRIEYKKKEIAKIASEIKKTETSFYSLQVGAFSNKEIAEKLKNTAESKGYQAFIKESQVNGKLLYKVYVGKYPTREEAQKYISQIASALKVEKPFVVEIK